MAPTEPARRYALGRSAPDRVVMSPPGVDVHCFDWDVTPVDVPPAVLYAGTLAPGRGVRLLLRAMAEVVRALPARLLLVGPIAPGFDAALRTAIHELGLAGRAELPGPIHHDLMPAMIGRATVCVAPSAVDLPYWPYALYPTTLLEYQACRRAPVVAARRGATTAIIEHGRDGLLFQPGDAGDLAHKLIRLLQDRGLRERLAAAGYERVRRELTASAARRAITAAYARLAARHEWQSRVRRGRDRPERGDAGAGRGRRRRRPRADGVRVRAARPGLGHRPDRARPGRHRGGRRDVVAVVEVALAGLAGEAALADSADFADDAALAGAVVEDAGDTPMPEELGPPGADDTQERALGPRPTRAADRRRRDDDEGTPLDVQVAPPAVLDAGGLVAGGIHVPTSTPELVDDRGWFGGGHRPRGTAALM